MAVRAVVLALALLVILLQPAAIAADPPVPRLPAAQEVDRGDRPARTIEMRVTAYTDHDTGMDGKGITASGKRTGPGTCAVDPGVIPLGTHLWIPGYGAAVAADTGSVIRGRRVDVWFARKATADRWGVQQLQVEVLPAR